MLILYMLVWTRCCMCMIKTNDFSGIGIKAEDIFQVKCYWILLPANLLTE